MPNPVVISSLSLIVSLITLVFIFKKDAHRIRLNLVMRPNKYVDYLSINNDSSFPVRISAVGHINHTGKITWLDTFGDTVKNNTAPYPIDVGARTTFNGFKTYGGIPSIQKCGYCVQLDCGRTFVAGGELPKNIVIKFKLMSFISWVSTGHLGFQKNDIHIL